MGRGLGRDPHRAGRPRRARAARGRRARRPAARPALGPGGRARGRAGPAGAADRPVDVQRAARPAAALRRACACCWTRSPAGTAGWPRWPGCGFGLGLLVRIDALRDLVLLIPVVAWLAARRHPGWLPLAARHPARHRVRGRSDALVVDPGVRVRPLALGPARRRRRGGADGAGRGRRPAGPPGHPLAADPAVVAARPRHRGRGRRRSAWPACSAGWRSGRWSGPGTARCRPGRSSSRCSGNEGLPVDGSRNYAEQSVRWASWYVGWPALALAASAAVLLTWRAVRGDRDAGRWALGLGVPLVSALTVLEQPAITPDHPWADRRLVPTVLPVVAAARAVVGRPRWPGPPPGAFRPGGPGGRRRRSSRPGWSRCCCRRRPAPGRCAGPGRSGASPRRSRPPAPRSRPATWRAGRRPEPAGVDGGAAARLRDAGVRRAGHRDRPDRDPRRGGRRDGPGPGGRPPAGAGRPVEPSRCPGSPTGTASGRSSTSTPGSTSG